MITIPSRHTIGSLFWTVLNAKRPNLGRISLHYQHKLVFSTPRVLQMASLRRSTRKSTNLAEGPSTISEIATVKVKVENSKKASKNTKDVVGSEPAQVGTKRKAENVVKLPITPKKKSKNQAAQPSETSVAVAEPETPKPAKTPRRVRRADPHGTNAPLQTPGGSKVLKAYPSTLFETPSQEANALSKDTVTTENLLERACAHLCAVDPKLQHVIYKHPCKHFSPEGLAEVVDPFVALCSSIIAQQVSGAAASSIKRKFISLFYPEDEDTKGSSHPITDPNRFPKPAEVAATPVPTLRTAGLSERKAEYIQGLAAKFASGELSAQMLVEASDEELLEKLIAVRGLGRWSVEMFACFALKRMDIFSTGDLGVQRGMAAYVGKDVSKLKAKGGGKWKYMNEKDMLEIANKFVPYR
jgi:DNA-3-methyladenine glycosylase II